MGAAAAPGVTDASMADVEPATPSCVTVESLDTEAECWSTTRESDDEEAFRGQASSAREAMIRSDATVVATRSNVLTLGTIESRVEGLRASSGDRGLGLVRPPRYIHTFIFTPSSYTEL